MKLGIYCRNSKVKEDGKGRSISNQKHIGIKKASALKMQYELYVDEGISGASDEIKDRPEFERLLNDIAQGNIKAVFAYDQSRFERNPKVRFVINKLFKDCDVEYYTHVDGLVDLYDPQAELFGDMQSVFNKYHVTMTKIKVKSVLKQRAEEGKAHGILPYGYSKDANGKIIIDKNEAIIIKRIFSLSLKGTGTRSIASLLNRDSIPTRYNKLSHGTLSVKNRYTKVITTKDKKDIKWSGNTIRNIITNTIYKGERVFSNQVINVPAILEPEYWTKANLNLANNANNTGKKVVHRYLLKGLIRCAVCGRNMYGRSRESKKDHFYMCSSKRLGEANCGNRSINIDKIENFIWEQLFAKKGFLTSLETEFKYNKNELQLIKENMINEKKTIEALNTERQRGIDLRVKGLINDNDLQNISRRYELNIKEATLRLKDLDTKYNNMIQGEELIKNFKDNFVDYTTMTSFEQKRNVVNEFIKDIKIGFVNDSHFNIDIEYKGGLGSENWKTPDYRANNFYTMRYNKKGEMYGFVSAPRSINNPEDDSNIKKFFATSGDFKLVGEPKKKK